LTSPLFTIPSAPPQATTPEPLGRGQPLRQAHASFASMLGRMQSDPTQSPQQQARAAAEQFVAQTFVNPILKQFRESDRTPPPFAPSQGEKQFRALMDAELAQQLVQSQRFPLVDRLAHDLLRHSRP
jgi:Rod binding domain-containing protein